MVNARQYLPNIDVPEPEIRLCRCILQDAQENKFKQISDWAGLFLRGQPYEIFPYRDQFLLLERNRVRDLQQAEREFFLQQRQLSNEGLGIVAVTQEEPPQRDQINAMYAERAQGVPWRVYRPESSPRQDEAEKSEYYSSDYYEDEEYDDYYSYEDSK